MRAVKAACCDVRTGLRAQLPGIRTASPPLSLPGHRECYCLAIPCEGLSRKHRAWGGEGGRVMNTC